MGLAAALAGSLGCGVASPADDLEQTSSGINVSTWAGLTAMGSTGTYVLTADINASGKTWTPKAFSGTFDGGNHTISNLAISNGSFFSNLTNATVKNVRFTSMTITGSSSGSIGGLAASSTESTIQSCAVEANISASAFQVGGIIGLMTGGSIYRSYAKGSITGSSVTDAGGLVGEMQSGSAAQPMISESYAQVTVNPGTSTSNWVIAGGLVGAAFDGNIFDVYAVGNVTGRGQVGGLVGLASCTPDLTQFFLYKGIYRGGDVVDKNKTGGWSGVVGDIVECGGSRFESNLFDKTADPSGTYLVHATAQKGATTTELRSPTTAAGGIYCWDDFMPGRCADDIYSTPPWDAGNSSQHHILMNMPGPNVQVR